MSVVLTVRIQPSLLAKAEARAARLGLDRASYVRSLIESDLLASQGTKTRFASEDLVGAYRLGGKSASNARVRETLRRRSSAHETHR
jgi:hypothetical protein